MKSGAKLDLKRVQWSFYSDRKQPTQTSSPPSQEDVISVSLDEDSVMQLEGRWRHYTQDPTFCTTSLQIKSSGKQYEVDWTRMLMIASDDQTVLWLRRLSRSDDRSHVDVIEDLSMYCTGQQLVFVIPSYVDVSFFRKTGGFLTFSLPLRSPLYEVASLLPPKWSPQGKEDGVGSFCYDAHSKRIWSYRTSGSVFRCFDAPCHLAPRWPAMIVGAPSSAEIPDRLSPTTAVLRLLWLLIPYQSHLESRMSPSIVRRTIMLEPNVPMWSMLLQLIETVLDKHTSELATASGTAAQNLTESLHIISSAWTLFHTHLQELDPPELPHFMLANAPRFLYCMRSSFSLSAEGKARVGSPGALEAALDLLAILRQLVPIVLPVACRTADSLGALMLSLMEPEHVHRAHRAVGDALFMQALLLCDEHIKCFVSAQLPRDLAWDQPLDEPQSDPYILVRQVLMQLLRVATLEGQASLQALEHAAFNAGPPADDAVGLLPVMTPLVDCLVQLQRLFLGWFWVNLRAHYISAEAKRNIIPPPTLALLHLYIDYCQAALTASTAVLAEGTQLQQRIAASYNHGSLDETARHGFAIKVLSSMLCRELRESVAY